MNVSDVAIDALVAGVEVDPADVMALAGALSVGEPQRAVTAFAEAAASEFPRSARGLQKVLAGVRPDESIT